MELFLTWTSKFCAALLALGSMVDEYGVLDDSYDALAGDPQYPHSDYYLVLTVEHTLNKLNHPGGRSFASS